MGSEMCIRDRLTICAVISGAEGWEDIEDFGETHLDFLKQYGDFENGIPVHDTIAVSYTHLRAHETDSYLVCRLLLEKKKQAETSYAVFRLKKIKKKKWWL